MNKKKIWDKYNFCLSIIGEKLYCLIVAVPEFYKMFKSKLTHFNSLCSMKNIFIVNKKGFCLFTQTIKQILLKITLRTVMRKFSGGNNRLQEVLSSEETLLKLSPIFKYSVLIKKCTHTQKCKIYEIKLDSDKTFHYIYIYHIRIERYCNWYYAYSTPMRVYRFVNTIFT